MLVLARRRSETVVLRDKRTNEIICEVMFVEQRSTGVVRLGFESPEWVSVHRKEIDDAVQISMGADR